MFQGNVFLFFFMLASLSKDLSFSVLKALAGSAVCTVMCTSDSVIAASQLFCLSVESPSLKNEIA